MLRVLLDFGGVSRAVNTRTSGDGLTPLHVAAIWGREECVQLLLENGADPVITDMDDMTPLDHAQSEGHQ